MVLVLALTFVAPSVLSTVSFAADDSSNVNVWDTLDPAYTSAEFNSVEARIAGDTNIAKMELILVNEGYALYNDPLNGEVICLKLAPPNAEGEYEMDENGVYKYVGYYCTNPYKVGQSKSVGKEQATSVSVKKTLLSQIVIKYKENTNETTLESYASSALFDQITCKKIRGGLRVEYTIGREETTYLVPRQIRFDKWMELLIQISENSAKSKVTRTFMAYYTLRATSVEQLTSWGDTFKSTRKDSISDVTWEYLFQSKKDYLATNPPDPGAWGIYAGVYESYVVTQRDKSNKTLKENEEKFPCTKNFAIMVFEGTAKAAELRKVEQYVKLYTDYSKERLEEDHAETEYTANDKIPALFKLAVEYTLDENGLYIRLNSGKIRFDSSNYTLQSISFLPYAGAVDTHDEGFIFSPDGSGTMFSLKDIAGKQFTTTSQIYGADFAYHTISGASKEVVRYPAFGAVETVVTYEEYTDEDVVIDPETGEEIVTEITKTRDIKTNYGYLAMLTAGDSLAKLTVNNGGSLHMYASAYTTFNPRPSDTYRLNGGISAGSDAMWTVESKRRYTGDYGLRIFILDGENASIAGMANTYRNYLENQGYFTKLEKDPESSEDIPLYIQTLGAIDTTKTFLGVPVTKSVPLTSFDDIITILTNLKEMAGITNVKVLMEGWCNDGMIPLVPSEIEICDALGGEKKFKELISYAADKANGNIQLFPNLDFVLAAKDEMFDGFDSDDLAKTIDDRSTGLRYYDPLYQGYNNARLGIISSNVVEKFYEKAMKDYKKYDIGGIAVTTLGQYLSSDFNEDDPLNREDSKKIVTRLIKKIREDNVNVLVSGGNYYVWPYVTDIIEVPLDDSRYKYTSASVPFYGMVIHGYIDFTGTAINLAGDYQYQLLKTIENGADPFFVIAYENTSELKNYNSNYLLSKYYSVKYSIWFNDIKNTYNTLNNALKDVKYSLIVGHEYLDPNKKVVKVTYDNGTVFLINYLETDYEVTYGDEEIVIKANDFVKTTVKDTEEKGEVVNG